MTGKNKPTLRILVDDQPKLTSKEALALPSLSGLTQRVVEVDAKLVQESMQNTIDEVLQVADRIMTQNERVEVTEVKLSLAVEGSGEVSLISLAKGTVAGRTGIEVTIRRRAH